MKELHIRNLRLHERELCPSEEVDQTTSPWSKCSLPNERISEIYSVRLQQFGVVLWWNMPVTSTHGPKMGNGSNWVFRRDSRMSSTPRTLQKNLRNLCAESMQGIQLPRCLLKYKRCVPKRTYIRFSSRRGSHLRRCTTTSTAA